MGQRAANVAYNLNCNIGQECYAVANVQEPVLKNLYIEGQLTKSSNDKNCKVPASRTSDLV